jgi:hypothetical protein
VKSISIISAGEQRIDRQQVDADDLSGRRA